MPLLKTGQKVMPLNPEPETPERNVQRTKAFATFRAWTSTGRCVVLEVFPVSPKVYALTTRTNQEGLGFRMPPNCPSG